MSKRTANLIVISFHAEASSAVHCAPQLGRLPFLLFRWQDGFTIPP